MKYLGDMTKGELMRLKTVDGHPLLCVFGSIDGTYASIALESDTSRLWFLHVDARVKLVDGRWEIAE